MRDKNVHVDYNALPRTYAAQGFRIIEKSGYELHTLFHNDPARCGQLHAAFLSARLPGPRGIQGRVSHLRRVHSVQRIALRPHARCNSDQKIKPTIRIPHSAFRILLLHCIHSIINIENNDHATCQYFTSKSQITNYLSVRCTCLLSRV